MLRLINHARTSRGLAAVKVVGALDRAALSHARDMLARDYFSHCLSAAPRCPRELAPPATP